MRLHRSMGVVAALCVAAGCSTAGDAPETVRRARAALTGGTTPVPATKDAHGRLTVAAWSGTAAELLFADALAICTTMPGGRAMAGDVTDERVIALAVQMDETLSRFPSVASRSWLALRSDATLNAKPVSNTGMSVGLEPAYPAAYDVSAFGGAAPGLVLARGALGAIAVNLCIARGMTEQTRLGGLLLTSAVDQRQVWSTIRERAQIAMLELASVATMLALPDVSAGADWAGASLRAWAKAGTGPGGEPAADVIAGWSRDLGEAVHLHVGATERLAELLVRSAASRAPLPVDTNPYRDGALSTDGFAPNGWRARLLGLMYGGDPLSNAAPGAAPPGGNASDVASWPSFAELPAASAGLWSARALRFQMFARQLDALTLTLQPGVTAYTSRADVDDLASALALYRSVEAALRTRACDPPTDEDDEDDEGTCPVVSPAAISETLSVVGVPASTLRAWTRYQLTPGDALELVRAVRDVLPSTSAIEGLHLIGSTELVAPTESRPAQLRLSAKSKSVPRTMLEAASLFARYGRHHVPTSVGAGELPPLSIETLDEARTMGAVPALAAVREALATCGGSTGVAQAFTRAGVDALIASAIGVGQTSLRPAEVTATVPSLGGGRITLVHASGATPETRRWTLRMVPRPGDAFYEGRAAEYTVLALRDVPKAMSVLVDPSNLRAGFGSAHALAAQATGQASVQKTGDALTATIDLPESGATTLLLRRRTRTGFDYRPVTGPLRLWATRSPAGRALPVESVYLAVGGRFTSLATRAWTLAESDLAQPAFDGLGQLRATIPDRSAETSAGGAPLAAYLARWMRSAADSEALATKATGDVLDELRRDAETSVDVEAARMKSVADTRFTLGELCGAAGAEAGSSTDTNAAAACGVTTTRLSAYVGSLDFQVSVAPMGGAEAAMAAALAPMKDVFSFPVELASQVAAVADSPTPSTFAPVAGQLQMRLMDQHKALRLYRATVSDVERAGRIALLRAKAADEALKLADLELTLADERAKTSRTEGLNQLAELSRQTAAAVKKARNTEFKFHELIKVDVNSLGPEDKIRWRTLQNELDEVRLLEGHARQREGDYARYLGRCRIDVTTPDDVAAYGACPSPLPSGSLFRVLEAETSVDHQKAAIARLDHQIALQDSIRQMREKMTEVSLRSSELLAQSASLAGDLLTVNLKIEQARVGARIEATRAGVRFAVSRAFQANGMWAAEGLLESARQAAVKARRAAEFVYATDLSSEGEALPTVGAPSQWADQVFDRDLSPLRVLGASSGLPAPTTLYANKLRDYGTNLAFFSDGFFGARRVSVTPMGATSTWVDGPARTFKKVVEDGDTVTELVAPTPGAAMWRVQCPAGAACAPDGGWCAASPGGSFGNACARPSGATGPALKPVSAKTSFHLDAWGHAEDSDGPTLSEKNRLNGRWYRFAVNLVGERIRTCPVPPPVDRGRCAANLSTVGYILRHKGPFLVTDARRSVRALALEPRGVSGEAYDRGARVEPLITGLDALPLSSLRRAELLGYPLEGDYEIELTPRDADDLGKVEEIQIVYDATFWQPDNQ